MITITIKTENAAFADSARAAEIARILREVADRLTSGYMLSERLRDANGNNVGRIIRTGADRTL